MEKRSPNFTSTEVDFLLSAVKKWRHIIECKKSDQTSSEEKLKVWKDIEREFNSKYSHTFRSHKVLKTKYGYLKTVSKQNFAADKRATYGTGGGSTKPKSTTKNDHAILEICQDAQVLGKQSHFDGDADDDCDFAVEMLDDFCDFPAEMLDEAGGVDTDDSVEYIEEVKDCIDEDALLKNNDAWKKYTPRMLKKPLSTPLKRKKETTSNKWAKVAERKIVKHNLEVELLREKHNLEVELLREKHNLEVELLRENKNFLAEKNELERQKLCLEIELLQTKLRNAQLNDED